jgi:hypothetical protein
MRTRLDREFYVGKFFDGVSEEGDNQREDDAA